MVIQVQGRDEVSASESERRVMLTSVSRSFSVSRSMGLLARGLLMRFSKFRYLHPVKYRRRKLFCGVRPFCFIAR